MELVGFIVELLLEVLGEPVFTLLGRALGATLPSRWQDSPVFAAAGYLLLGLLSGALSLWWWPTHLLRDAVLRGVTFVLSPIVCGLVLFVVGSLRARRGHARQAIDGAGYGMLMGITYQLVRLVGAA